MGSRWTFIKKPIEERDSGMVAAWFRCTQIGARGIEITGNMHGRTECFYLIVVNVENHVYIRYVCKMRCFIGAIRLNQSTIA